MVTADPDIAICLLPSAVNSFFFVPPVTEARRPKPDTIDEFLSLKNKKKEGKKKRKRKKERKKKSGEVSPEISQYRAKLTDSSETRAAAVFASKYFVVQSRAGIADDLDSGKRGESGERFRPRVYLASRFTATQSDRT